MHVRQHRHFLLQLQRRAPSEPPSPWTSPELPADVVRLQDIVRRQQAVIEELEGRLQDLSDDDDMDMGSTGLPTPRPVRVHPEAWRSLVAAAVAPSFI